MRRPIALFIGLRYLQASKGNGFVSFVNAASVLGVALGVAALIVVMSVMNGFENELRDRLLGLTAHASVLGEPDIANWPEAVEQLRGAPGVVGAAPYIELEGMLSGAGGMTAALVTGVEPELEADVSAIASSMVLGQLDDLRAGNNGVILGRALSRTLGVSIGDPVTLLVPLPVTAGGGISSRLATFTVRGIFELGIQDHDSIRALVHIGDAGQLLQMGEHISGIRVETSDIFSAPTIVREAVATLRVDEQLSVRDWTQENASYFRAIRLEKTMMALLLSLIIGVATFNIVAMLVMVVTEKRGGIAILRTLGCSSREVVAVFLLQGTLIGWLGAVTGIALGIWVTLNIESLAPLLESVFGFQFMPADLYYLTSLPADLHSSDVIWASIGVLLITAAATVYPALRAAKVQPAEVLRYV